MFHYYSVLCLFGISTYFFVGIVALEAIVGGVKLTGDEIAFRYQVALKYHDSLVYHCGGGIISDRFILTAAQCVVKSDGEIDRRRLSIVAGTSDLQKLNPPAVIVNVQTVYVPSEYVPFIINPVADIAVLKLVRPLQVASHMNLASMKLSNKINKSYPGKLPVIAGYGWHWIKIEAKGDIGGHNDTLLRYSTVVVLQDQLGYPVIRVPEKQIGGRIKQINHSSPSGTCNGDGGSPLVYAGNIVIGVLSTSAASCSEKNQFSVYTRVSHYASFIRDVMHRVHRRDVNFLDLL